MGRTLGALLLAGLLGFLSPAPGTAQQRPVDQASFPFDLPIGPLNETLSAFASITGWAVTSDAEQMRGVATAWRVSGDFTALEALERIVVGTGFGFTLNGSNGASIEPRAVALSGLHVVVDRNRGYKTGMSRTATKTETVLRDIPQSFSVIAPGDFPARVTLTLRPGRGAEDAVLTGSFGRLELPSVGGVFLRPARAPEPAPWSTDEAFREWTHSESRVALEALGPLLEGRWAPATPHVVRAAGLKSTQLTTAAVSGLATPRTLVTNDPAAFARFYDETNGRMVSKTLQARRTDVDGIPRFAFTHRVSRRDATHLNALRNGPVLLQELVPKALGIRATVVGQTVLAGAVDSQAAAATRDDSRRMADPRLRWREHALPPAVREGLLHLHERLGLCFSGADLILTPSGEYVFLEANPCGDWLFLEEDTGLAITDAVADLVVALAAKQAS